MAYEMILTGNGRDTMIRGYVAAEGDRKPVHWVATVSVESVDAAPNAAFANGVGRNRLPTSGFLVFKIYISG